MQTCLRGRMNQEGRIEWEVNEAETFSSFHLTTDASEIKVMNVYTLNTHTLAHTSQNLGHFYFTPVT